MFQTTLSLPLMGRNTNALKIPPLFPLVADRNDANCLRGRIAAINLLMTTKGSVTTHRLTVTRPRGRNTCFPKLHPIRSYKTSRRSPRPIVSVGTKSRKIHLGTRMGSHTFCPPPIPTCLPFRPEGDGYVIAKSALSRRIRGGEQNGSVSLICSHGLTRSRANAGNASIATSANTHANNCWTLSWTDDSFSTSCPPRGKKRKREGRRPAAHPRRTRRRRQGPADTTRPPVLQAKLCIRRTPLPLFLKQTSLRYAHSPAHCYTHRVSYLGRLGGTPLLPGFAGASAAKIDFLTQNSVTPVTLTLTARTTPSVHRFERGQVVNSNFSRCSNCIRQRCGSVDFLDSSSSASYPCCNGRRSV